MNLKDIQKKKDEEIIKYILESPDYYSVIISRYENKLRNYVLRISNTSRDEAEDLLQDIFIAVYQNLNSFNQNLSFSSWIYRISHNHVVNYWKKNKKHERVSIEQNLFFVETIFNENSIELEINNSLNNKEINQAFSEMDKKYREILILKFLENKDYQEISDILQKPMGSVATLINRGKKNFIQEYKKIHNETKF